MTRIVLLDNASIVSLRHLNMTVQHTLSSSLRLYPLWEKSLNNAHRRYDKTKQTHQTISAFIYLVMLWPWASTGKPNKFTGHPPYLTDLLQYHKSSVSTRSSTSQLLAIPRHNLSFGSHSFRVSAPRIWNSLTSQIRQCETLATFRRHLKTHYFQSTFSAT